MGGDFGDAGWCEEPADLDIVAALEDWNSMSATAGGGSSKDVCNEESCEPSLLLISVEDAGVGGCSGRGIMRASSTSI